MNGLGKGYNYNGLINCQDAIKALFFLSFYRFTYVTCIGNVILKPNII